MTDDLSPAPARKGPSLTGWGVVGLGAAALLGGAWTLRAQVLDAGLRSYAAARGVQADWRVTHVGLDGMRLANVRVGRPQAPDFTAREAAIGVSWSGFWPHVGRVTLHAPRLAARLDETGLNLGQLQRLIPKSAPNQERKIPDLALVATQGEAMLDTPWGVFPATLSASGHLRRDFVGAVTLADTALATKGGESLRAQGRFVARSGEGGLAAELKFSGAARTKAFSASAFQMDASGRAPFDLSSFPIKVRLRAENGRVGAVSAQEALVEGSAIVDAHRGLTARFVGPIAVSHARIDAKARDRALAAVPGLGGTPLAPLTTQAKASLQAAAQDFSGAAKVEAELKGEAFSLRAPDGLALRAASGAALRLDPRVRAKKGAVSGTVAASLTGPGLPALSVTEGAFAGDKKGLELTGIASIARWSAPGAAMTLSPTRFALDHSARGGGLALNGAFDLSGPLAGGAVEHLRGPLKLNAAWDRGFSLSLADDPCWKLEAASLSLASYAFAKPAFCLKPEGKNGALIARDSKGVYSGGASASRLALAGAAARFSSKGLSVRFSGAGPMRVDAALPSPRFESLAADSGFVVAAPNLSAVAIVDGANWRAQGALQDAVFTSAAARLSKLQGAWTMRPGADGEVVLDFANGRGLATDVAPEPRFAPLALRDVSARLQGETATAKGRFELASGEAKLGGFSLTHDLKSGAGKADAEVRGLQFNEKLELYEISELARGVAENVQGAVDAQAHVSWSRAGAVRSTGLVKLNEISAATIGLGLIEGVNGEIHFDDLIALTTPPGQTLSVRRVNPGVAVENGEVRLQLLPEGRARLEDAAFPFAGGRLSVEPALLDFSALESRYVVRLTDVDVETFVRALNFKGLAATGTVAGRFPLIFTKMGGRIEGGELKADKPGEIRYSGETTQAAKGNIAFDALKNFRYDTLTIGLNGDLDGEIVTDIRFGGVNAEPIHPPTLAPGLKTFGTTGLPFRFNVTVRAPFRALFNQAQYFSDPLKRLEDDGTLQRGGSAPVQP